MLTIRRATLEDIGDLTELRQQFLVEIDYAADEVRRATRAYLVEALPRGDFVAFVAEVDGGIVATSGVMVFQKAPHGRNLSGKEGFILNMYTLPDWRRQGIATALMQRVLEYLQQAGAGCVSLHTSDDGRGIYTSLGFRPDNSEMILYLAEAGQPQSTTDPDDELHAQRHPVS